MINIKNSLMLFALLGPISVLSARVKVEKNINYTEKDDERRQLNVYYQQDKSPKDVIVFIHGGSWSSGKKDIYPDTVGQAPEITHRTKSTQYITHYQRKKTRRHDCTDDIWR